MQDRKKSGSISGWLQVISFLAVYLFSFLAMAYALPFIPQNGFVNSLILPLGAGAFLSVVLVLSFAKLFFKRDTTELGLKWNGYQRKAMAGACLGIFLITAGSMILYSGNWLHWTSSEPVLTQLLLISALIIVSAFSEELVFRGFILGRLLSTNNRYVALLVSSVLFSLFHINNPDVSAIAIINIFLGGLLLGMNYIYTRNIWFGFMLHVTWNLVQGPLMGIPVSGLVLPSLIISEINGPVLITGGNFGLEGSVIQGVLLLVCNMAVWYLNERRNIQPATAKKI